MLAGQLDPITPTYDSRAVAEQLPNGRYVEFPGFSHGVLSTVSSESAEPPCAARLVNAFLDDPGAPLDTACLGAIPPLRFAGT